MAQNADVQISINHINNVVIATIHSEFADEIIEQLKMKVLKDIYDRHSLGLIVDLSLVSIIDSFVLRLLLDLSDMAALMGAKTFFVGIRPEIAASLVDFGKAIQNIRVVTNIDEAMYLIKKDNV